MAEDICSDLDKIAVQLCFIPLREDFVHLIAGKAEPVAHQLVSLADQLHVAVLNAVMDHLHKMPCTVFTDPVTAGGTVFYLGTDALENRFDIRPCCGGTAGHQGGAFQGAFFSTGDTCSDIEKALAFHIGCAACRIGEMAVAAVNQNIALFETGDKGLDQVIYGFAGFDHHEDPAGLFQRSCELFQRVSTDEFLTCTSSVDESIHFFRGPVVNCNCESLGFHVHGKILAHYGEADHSNVCFFHG